MVGCVLRVTGEALKPDIVLAEIALTPNSVFHKGDAKSRNRVWETSGLTFIVSDALGNDLKQQIRDAVAFLRKYNHDVSKLGKAAGLDDLRLEFNVDKKKGFLQDTFFPSNLVKAAGGLNIGLELLIYG